MQGLRRSFPATEWGTRVGRGQGTVVPERPGRRVMDRQRAHDAGRPASPLKGQGQGRGRGGSSLCQGVPCRAPGALPARAPSPSCPRRARKLIYAGLAQSRWRGSHSRSRICLAVPTKGTISTDTVLVGRHPCVRCRYRVGNALSSRRPLPERLLRPRPAPSDRSGVKG